MGGTPEVLWNYIIINKTTAIPFIGPHPLTSLISPALVVGLSDDAVDTLDVLRSFGRCLTTSLLRTSWTLRSEMSEEDLTVNRLSPPDCVLLREGE